MRTLDRAAYRMKRKSELNMTSRFRNVVVKRIWTAALSCVLLTVSAHAHTSTQALRTGTVKGTVFDPNEAVIPGVKVIFMLGGKRQQVVTDTTGEYEIDLERGTYELAAGATGFCWFRRSQIRVEAGTGQIINITLKAGAIANIIKLDGNKYVGEEDVWIDPDTGSPCGFNTPAKPAATTVSEQGSNLRRGGQSTTVPGRAITVISQAKAIVWVDDVRRGTTGESGKLQIKLTLGRHSLRVRADGFAERTLTILPTQRGEVVAGLTKTTDEAELLFQRAEDAREEGLAQQAVDLYHQALKLRPRFAAAHLGLARTLESQENFDDALTEVEAARRDRPAYAEASAVEGRLLRSGQYEDAGAAFRKAIAQLSDTEPILYELLGRDLEKLERWKDAVAAYEKYLELAPNGSQASAINSIIDQLRKQAAEAGQQTPPD